MSLLCQFWVISVCTWFLFCAEDILYVLFLYCRCSGNPSHTSQQVCVGVLFILDFLLATCCLATIWSAFTARLSGIPLCKGKCVSSHRVQLSSCKTFRCSSIKKSSNGHFCYFHLYDGVWMFCDGNVQPYSSNFYKPWGQQFIKFILAEFAVAGETCSWDSCTNVACKGGCHFTLPYNGYRNKETADSPDPSVLCWQVFLENDWLLYVWKKASPFFVLHIKKKCKQSCFLPLRRYWQGIYTSAKILQCALRWTFFI